MPVLGERCTHDCPDCGQPMYWTEAVVHHLSQNAGAGFPAVEYVDAYRCANGHTNPQCPLCGSYDTAAWSDRPHYHVICGACGNDSILAK